MEALRYTDSMLSASMIVSNWAVCLTVTLYILNSEGLVELPFREDERVLTGRLPPVFAPCLLNVGVFLVGGQWVHDCPLAVAAAAAGCVFAPALFVLIELLASDVEVVTD